LQALFQSTQHIYEKREGSGAGAGSGSGRPKPDPDPQHRWLHNRESCNGCTKNSVCDIAVHYLQEQTWHTHFKNIQIKILNKGTSFFRCLNKFVGNTDPYLAYWQKWLKLFNCDILEKRRRSATVIYAGRHAPQYDIQYIHFMRRALQDPPLCSSTEYSHIE
jgi:hypothetical protein